MIAKLCILFGLCSGNIVGPAYVVDGDTIRIDGQSIRLQGVDAEELSESNGHAAKNILEGIIRNKAVTCVPDGTTSYKRIVATCTVDGIDIGLALIAGGYALDCPRYSKGRYAQYELPGARQHLTQKGYCR